MKKIENGGDIRAVNLIHVSIEFSKEIAYWDDKAYHLNPKFYEFWDKVNAKPKYREFNWEVFYCGKGSMELAGKGELDSNILRVLGKLYGETQVWISPKMSLNLMHGADRFCTPHSHGLQELVILCRDCARYCGGTVEITYSARQRRFVWDDVEVKTLKTGKGYRRWKAVEPKRTKTAKECEFK
jgi:hypothetical protein